MHDELPSYRTPLVRFLVDYMRENQEAGTTWLKNRQDLVLRAAAIATAIYPSGAFRVTDAQGNPTEKSVNRALFDAQMLAFSAMELEDAEEAAPTIRREIGRLFYSDDFQNAIRRATGDKTRLRDRVLAVIGALSEAGVSVDDQVAKGHTEDGSCDIAGNAIYFPHAT
jgi:hypothetical protein